MKVLKYTGFFLGMVSAMVILTLGFCMATNNIYFTDGKTVDFSLYGWGGMLVVWLAGVWQWRKGESFLIGFAVQLAVICCAFDLWRLFVFGSSREALLQVEGIVLGEAALLVLLLCLKKKALAGMTLAAGLTAWYGGYIASQFFMPNAQMFAVAGIALLVGVALYFLPQRRKASLLLLAFILGGVSLAYWYNFPGIRFYEARVEKTAGAPKVSVIVPVYNGETYLKQCLDSIRRQTLKDIEIICIDDGSTDGTAEILAEYAAHDARFKVITQENRHIGAARNTGMAAAKGEYIGFVDADDTISADYYESLYTAAKAQQDTDVAVAQNIFKYIARGYKSRMWNTDGLSAKKIKVPDKPLENVSSVVWDKIYRRSFLTENGILFPERRCIWEDIHFFVNIMLKQPVVIVVENGEYYYRRYIISVSRRNSFSFNENVIPLLHEMDIMIEQSETADKQAWMKYMKTKREYILMSSYKLLSEEDRVLLQKQYNEFWQDDGFDFEKELEKQREKRHEPKEGMDNTAAGEKEGADGREASVSEKNAA